MAKSKITFEWDTDMHERSVLVVKRKRGQLTYRDVVETLTEDGRFCGMQFLMPVRISDYIPEDLYDEGDIWLLYTADDFFGKFGADRLISKKPIMVSKTGNKLIGTCPTCSADVKKTGINDMYCTCCGQEIDWRKEDER